MNINLTAQEILDNFLASPEGQEACFQVRQNSRNALQRAENEALAGDYILGELETFLSREQGEEGQDNFQAQPEVIEFLADIQGELLSQINDRFKLHA